MFLANLERNQKNAFLGLAHALIAADGVLEARELSTMEQYRQEMNLHLAAGEEFCGTEQAIAVFNAASLTVKKRIMFELVALSYADQNFAEAENVLIEKIQTDLGLDRDFLETSKTYVTELMDLYGRISRLVG